MVVDATVNHSRVAPAGRRVRHGDAAQKSSAGDRRKKSDVLFPLLQPSEQERTLARHDTIPFDGAAAVTTHGSDCCVSSRTKPESFVAVYRMKFKRARDHSSDRWSRGEKTNHGERTASTS
jgi:hypothetical protein